MLKLLAAFPIIALSACAMQSEMATPKMADVDLGRVQVVTSPVGVVATSHSGYRCVTPCTLELSSHRGGLITFEKEGYAVEQRYVTAGVGYSRPPRLFGNYGPLLVVPEPGPGDAMIQYRYFLDEPNPQFANLDVRRVSVDMVPDS